jgi:WD40 repeat protein
MPPFRPSLALFISLTLAPAVSADRGPQSSEAAATPAVKRPARTDRYGDPLPPGALARLGTMRLRVANIQFLAFMPGGRTVASADLDTGRTNVCEWDVATGRRVRHFSLASMSSGVLSPDGKLLVTVSNERPTGTTRIRIWDWATGKERRQLPASDSVPSAVAFSPDSKVLATAGQDKVIRLWDLASGAERRQLTDGRTQWWQLLFSPDGKTLAAASSGRTVALWNLGAGPALRQLEPHAQEIADLAFAPDGQTIATAGFGDPIIRLWGGAPRARGRGN